jgi:hypothetical protein
VEKMGNKRRARGPSPRGCFEQSKQEAQLIIDSEREQQTEALKILRMTNPPRATPDPE